MLVDEAEGELLEVESVEAYSKLVDSSTLQLRELEVDAVL